jgi:hypothetical protein
MTSKSTFPVAEINKAAPKWRFTWGPGYAAPPHAFALLRLRPPTACRRASDQRDELAPPHVEPPPPRVGPPHAQPVIGAAASLMGGPELF